MKIIPILQLVTGIFLILFILLQRGGGGFLEESQVIFQRRGAEKILFGATIISACLFFLFAILNFLL